MSMFCVDFRGGKNYPFFYASRFSLERFYLNADKLIIFTSFVLKLSAATFCSPSAKHYRKLSFLPEGSLRR